MFDRRHFIRVHGVSAEHWAERRGLVAPACPCGALPPYCVVLAGGGELGELLAEGARV